ncbi:hypothetical protein [Piscibacillus salipiscarius]|uniref:hypothetical protein n=1 Tax=Piscibacillus salipiscarius TaxID=299480 RepID=UPI000B283DA3|nr:hypothetical protein [Piscibacillus salipiscarius]
MYKKISLVTLFLVLIFGSVFTNADTQKLEDPKLVAPQDDGISIMGKASNGNDETPGEWYIGSTPSNLDPSKPILLFVHGLNSTAQIWWEDNDMYQTAYDAGYQTTFLQLHDAGGYNEDMWDNGQLLAEKSLRSQTTLMANLLPSSLTAKAALTPRLLSLIMVLINMSTTLLLFQAHITGHN